ncbi:hypothetical protein EWM64_g6485 [Hericium alpestre]|uniref:Uncharacterized protein n=1 Tax=Hericium alpestre TaxID=135208 RepID=A0A4Y9ZTZ8_9AGAM|nr:hypothetical protein EWM64_g6485 [Hericium alpestre]
MRLEHKWASFTMTSRAWIDATTEYNQRLRSKNSKKGLPTINKHPDALMSKLKVIEGMVKTRIKENDFKCNSEDGLDRILGEAVPRRPLEKPDAKPRKTQVCTRCKTVKYPCGTGSPENHKLRCCSDGVKISDDKDTPPPWPQPSGIYRDGTHFHPTAFLDTVHDVYERIIVEGQNPLDLPIDLITFTLTLDMRLVKQHMEDKILFKLWEGLEIEGPPLDDHIVCVAGHQFLAIEKSVLVVGSGTEQLTAAGAANPDDSDSTRTGLGTTSAGAGGRLERSFIFLRQP